MATGETEDALGQQIRERMSHFPRLPLVDEAAGEAVDQPVARLGRREQDRAPIRARVRLIERRDQRLLEQIRKENSLWYRGLVQQ